MKFVISMLWISNLMAAPIDIQFERGQEIEARIYNDILINDYSIPEDLIKMTLVNDCEKRNKNAELEICIKNNGDLKVVSADKNFIRESLSVFKAP